ncbi:hypothetical protein [Rivularia sp. UHCC 0363]|uniref:hypothetical protein n=1 Tax=Rivularia sp. UHCC 0363 TaxID=3110244 RepID=UPI002B20E9A4|nr:hypothetical protein [Rivularia sp. UHCC 0363]MEA5594339.1 hypothetical protein [Rivularia sp. UHCC 0363]
MKKVLTIRSMLFNSLLVVIFAACGANAQKKAEICSNVDSKMFIPGNDAVKSQNQENPDPMVLPKNPDFDSDSHPMIVLTCPQSEK